MKKLQLKNANLQQINKKWRERRLSLHFFNSQGLLTTVCKGLFT
ncbi:hypothetical protein HMPREF0083_04795 [Aneurinibacillus aneurinilyticus ATCC 12856]|uniref:Uncharacterized protein n=1 Tax=Aneurinibacillus aneurinilyticus ATCC 12856 TaxID=649747 RepID=U1Y4Q4_ANEAE|nr:hypothetical protein HMPREF0083_04795 [Aneurinibacillus aneurinilyticus ATCC 12856]